MREVKIILLFLLGKKMERNHGERKIGKGNHRKLN